MAPFGMNCLPIVLNESQILKICLSKSNWQNSARVVIDSHTIKTITKEDEIYLRYDEKDNVVDLICKKDFDLMEGWMKKLEKLMKWN